MSLMEKIKDLVGSLPADLLEKNGTVTVEQTVAERKALLSKKKLTYIARFRIDEAAKVLSFTEMLKEAGFGLGGGEESDMSPGLGFKAESYNTKDGARRGSIQEQSNFFAKKYNYTFDFAAFRERIKEAAVEAGYQFSYKIAGL